MLNSLLVFLLASGYLGPFPATPAKPGLVLKIPRGEVPTRISDRP